LIGTWADASWAIQFYERTDFSWSVRRERSVAETVLDIPDRQIDTSVVLLTQSGGN